MCIYTYICNTCKINSHPYKCLYQPTWLTSYACGSCYSLRFQAHKEPWGSQICIHTSCTRPNQAISVSILKCTLWGSIIFNGLLVFICPMDSKNQYSGSRYFTMSPLMNKKYTWSVIFFISFVYIINGWNGIHYANTLGSIYSVLNYWP